MNISNNIITPVNQVETNSKPKVDKGGFDAILEAAKASGNTDELKDACNQMEAVFLDMIMDTMRSSANETEGMFKKSDSEKMFQEMLDEEMTEKMSKSGGIGISDMIFDQMSKYLYNDEEKATSFEMKG